MAEFLTSLWESVFTPGPTPTLILATNYAFGALQLVLLMLLIATQSIHFVILSFLSAGLWYAINWFAAELQIAQAAEDKKTSQKEKEKGRRRRVSPEPGAGSDTETETQTQTQGVSTAKEKAPGGGGGGEGLKVERRKAPPKNVGSSQDIQTSALVGRESSGEGQGTAGAAPSNGLLQPETPASGGGSKGMADSDLLRRQRSLGESSGYVSTDSEWEKVDDEEGKH